MKQVFPALRCRAKERDVEVVDVDLRWGVTQEQAEGGHALEICLQEDDPKVLPWLPQSLPVGVQVVASTLAGQANRHLSIGSSMKSPMPG